jgi:hypothetical protein
VRRRTLRDSYLPYSRPWSHLFSGAATEAAGFESITSGIASLMDENVVMKDLPTRPIASGLQFPSIPRGARSPSSMRSREVWRARLDWHDVGLVSQPPEYVIDLLNQQPRPRRLKPLARRIVVLTEPGMLNLGSAAQRSSL